MKVGVVGGGGFGRGIAMASARQDHDVRLHGRSARTIEGVRWTSSLGDLADRDLIFMAVPSHLCPELSFELGKHLDGRHMLVHVSRGLVGDDLQTLSQVLRQKTPCRRVGALAGPLDADALAEGKPAGVIVGSRFPEVAAAVRSAIGGPALRIYESRDVLGVEIASAMVGLLALALGYGSEYQAGPSATAVLLTRGIAEATRVMTSLGGKAETMTGLAGFGDLIAVASGDDRPEIRLGRALASGMSIEDAGREAGAHIEGVSIAKRVSRFAERVRIEAPIANAIASVLSGELAPGDAITELMARRVGKE